jgi:predicted TIM-barrel fold metal-dependent hydrolase
MCKLPCDDPAVVNLFKLAGERGLLVTIESSSMLPGEAGLADEPGAPRLEHLLQLAPQTRIVGHGPAFWAEFGVVRTHAEKGTRAVGKPLGGDGALPRLFRTYPNLYADLSAASGFCALTREVNRGIEFLNEFQDRLLFGTDLISFGDARRRQELRAVGRRMIEKLITERKLDLADWQALDWHHSYMPQLDYLKALCSEGLLGREAYERIVGRNAAALLGLDESLGHP